MIKSTLEKICLFKIFQHSKTSNCVEKILYSTKYKHAKNLIISEFMMIEIDRL